MERLVVGRVGAPYGVRGWVHINSFLEPPVALLEVAAWSVRQGQKPWCEMSIEERREHGTGLVAKFAASGNREAAQSFRGADIGIWLYQMPVAEPGEYYWRDLLGAWVLADDDVELGKVSALMETGAHDVLVVTGERERLIPFVLDDVVEQVDLEQHIIRVHWHPDD